jgi:hypothetical protein
MQGTNTQQYFWWYGLVLEATEGDITGIVTIEPAELGLGLSKEGTRLYICNRCSVRHLHWVPKHQF